jgi:cytoskeletal protein CcmA (bactofilin family)
LTQPDILSILREQVHFLRLSEKDRIMFTRDSSQRRVDDMVGPIESVIAEETTLQGNLRSTHGIRIVGSVEGDIESRGRVKIEKGGRARGNITAPDVIVNGALEGHIEATGQVELGPESRMAGNIKAARIAIAEGCFFQGDIKMFHADERPSRFVEKRTVKSPAD